MTETKAFDRNELWKDLTFLSDWGSTYRKRLFEIFRKGKAEEAIAYIDHNFSVIRNKPVDKLDETDKKWKTWYETCLKVIQQWNEAIQNNNTDFKNIFNFWMSLFDSFVYHGSSGPFIDPRKAFRAQNLIHELFDENAQYDFWQHISGLLDEDEKFAGRLSEDEEIALYNLISNNKNATSKDLKKFLNKVNAFKEFKHEWNFEKYKCCDLTPEDIKIVKIKQQYLPVSQDYIVKIKAELDALLKMDPVTKAGDFEKWSNSVNGLYWQGLDAAQALFVELDEQNKRIIQSSYGKELEEFFTKIKENLDNIPTNYIQKYEHDKLAEKNKEIEEKNKEIEELQKQLLKANNEITARDKTIAMNKSTIETQKKAIADRDDIIAQQQNLISDYGNNAKAYDASRIKGKVYGHNSDDAKYEEAKKGAESLGARAKNLAKLIAQLERQ